MHRRVVAHDGTNVPDSVSSRHSEWKDSWANSQNLLLLLIWFISYSLLKLMWSHSDHIWCVIWLLLLLGRSWSDGFVIRTDRIGRSGRCCDVRWARMCHHSRLWSHLLLDRCGWRGHWSGGCQCLLLLLRIGSARQGDRIGGRCARSSRRWSHSQNRSTPIPIWRKLSKWRNKKT